MSRELTAAEAAARLGVKRATLYAYVSRGLIHRHLAMDGRTSLFDGDEVDAFRTGRRRRTDGELDTVISTGLTRVADGQLEIRGHDLVAMVAGGADYEQVVEVLWGGKEATWRRDHEIEQAVIDAQAVLPPDASAIDRLRLTTAVVSAHDRLRFDLSPASVRASGTALLNGMVAGFPLVGREAASTARLADRLWPRLTARHSGPDERDALNAAMGLLVDHGLASSTFAARVAASVRADPYSVVVAGLGPVGGLLHGAASRSVFEVLCEADAGEPSVAVGDAFRRSGAHPGFGHMVYRTEDPRYVHLMERVNAAWVGDPRLGTVHAVRDLISERTQAIPNVDLALGALSWLADMGPDAGEAVFAVARTAGWIAHGLEEYDETPLRFRPRARYTG